MAIPPPTRHAHPMRITEATDADWPAIWAFFQPITTAGETFTYPTDMGQDQARQGWLLSKPDRTVVALDEHGTVVGTAKMNRNHMGNADHIAGASYMVDPAHSGRGVGRALCEYSLNWARRNGYTAMQFNAVVATNTRAIGLYESLGFAVVGTLERGFRHPAHGHVGLHIMYRVLDEDPTW